MTYRSSTYYDNHYRQTAALIRARQPYLIKNIIGGLALTAMTIGIYAFTIRAVSQDDFSDVPIPDKRPNFSHTTTTTGVKTATNAPAVAEKQ